MALSRRSYINKRKSEQTRSKVAPENGTINRELALLKSAFNHGTEQTPPKVRFVPHFNMLEENNVRRGFLQDEQYQLSLRGRHSSSATSRHLRSQQI